MLAHDLLKQDDRAFTPTSSSKSASYFCVLILTKLLRCIGIFFLDILAKSTHIISLLWLLKSISSLILFPIQKPLTSGKTIRKPLFIRICRLSIVNCIVEALWFYGITFCGPLRSVLVFELSPSLLLIAVASFFKGSSTPAKSRGFMLLIVGFVSLMLMDRDQTISDSHADAHGHHSGFHYLRHVIDLFGFGDHQGGVVILFLALLLRIGYDSSFRHLAVEIGGPKRLYALVTAFSAIILIPLAVLAMVFGTSSQFSMSSTEFVPLLFVTAGFVMVLDFYAESICFQHVADPVLASARWSPITMFTCALGLAYMWYSSQNKAEHAITGGVLVTVVSFILASISLTSATTKHRGGGVYVGISATGLPLFADGEAFLKKTSQSLFVFFKETLRDILANKDSRRIFYFLCLNFSFCGVEFLYGFWTNSLGLISDGFHMLFDCSALVMGLVASVMARWPPSKHFTYGYGRVEVLSGFINALFLCVIAVFILIEALERLFDPPNVNTDKLLFIAISGLLVNLFGMYSFHGGDDGGHGHSHGGHGHSHGGHGHSHGNANMEGVFLHVLADALGSVFVIISTLLIQWFGWRWVDPLCSLILSLLILGSVYPLLMSSMSTLLQDIPDHEELDHHLAEILEVEGVQSFSNVHMWQQKGDMNVASISVQAQGNANGQAIRHKIAAILKTAGAALATVQVEKDYFAHKIQQLCPSYHFEHKVMRGSMMRSEKSHSHGHSHGACDDNHGHGHGGHGHSHNGGANHGHSHH